MAWPLAAAALVLTVVVRPPVARRETRWLDAALAVYVLFACLQRVPVPPQLRLGVSPALRAFDLQMRVDAPAAPANDAPHALTVDPEATTLSLLVAACVVLTFWCARAIFSRGGVRFFARGVALLGFGLAAFGIFQHTTAPHSFYGRLVPRQVTPFGPYLNHSDFATWLVMGSLLTAGYLIARLYSQHSPGEPILSADMFDNRAMWMTTALAAMAAALVVGLSRSGLMAAAAGLIALWTASSGRLERRIRVWLLAGFAAIGLAAAAFVNLTAVAGRIDETIRGVGGRTAIWRATWPMVKDFWPAGVGAGAYERAMIVYQPVPHETYFNHAHNDYLQMLAEGGLLLAIPALLALVAGVFAIRGRLRTDRSSIYWVRAGAVSGLLAVGVQSIWETGLRVPANTLLFAVLAAVAVHDAPVKHS